ncbi:MAG TPA: type II toxin-antitoxin system VapC family toxin [Chthoniobacterales bacterium]|nr:type II toxin-antitoxin system VapC family toxin [Chthoniobacterales bacterium]
MILCDVNVLIYAHRADAQRHAQFRDWLADQLTADAPFGFSELVLSSVIRVITNPHVHADATPLRDALGFAEMIRQSPHAIRVEPGGRHWSIFSTLCGSVRAKGNLVTDCYFAALAMEHGCEWISTDKHFARFPGLRWRHPLD